MRALEYDNICIMPFTEILDTPKGLSFHKGGPIWPAWDSQIEARHRHGDRLVDDKPVLDTNPEKAIINDKLLWCGPIVGHYGHQLADFMTRLPAYDQHDAFYCFATKERSKITEISKTPDFFRQILCWYRIDEARVFIVNSPITARKLYCLPQQERFGPPSVSGIPPSKEYLDILTANANRNGMNEAINKKGKYFISRAAMPAKLAGEGYLDYFMASKGVKVIRPEALSLYEQLRIYSTAQHLIFSEGSALHTIQLLGRQLVGTRIDIINRRPRSRLIENLLLARGANPSYHDIGTLVHGLNHARKPAKAVGINVATETQLRSVVRKLGVVTTGWSKALCNAFIADDVRTWLDKERASDRGNIPGSLEMIRTRLSSAGMESISQE